MEEADAPGQRYIPNFVIYMALGKPKVDINKYRFIVDGRVENELKLSYEELKALPMKRIITDFHCVTGWSVKEVEWEGVQLNRFAEMAKPMEDVEWVYFTSLDGYTTVVAFEDFMHEDSLLVLKMNGSPLPIEHGYPARIFIPHLYGWKGAKWVYKITFLDEYRDGYWEALGYSQRGRVFLEERFKTI